MAEIQTNQETAQDMIESSMRLIGAIGRGQSAAAQEHAAGLEVLNRLLDSWNQRRELIYEVSRNEATLTGNRNPHTIGLAVGSGSVGDIAVVRPQMIEDASVIPAGTTIELPVKVLTRDEYRAIPNKELSATYPTDLWYEREWPLGKIWLYPEPSGAAKLVYYVWKQLPSGMVLADEFSVPPGYLQAIRYTLAVEFAPEYGRMLEAGNPVLMTSQTSIAHLAARNLDKRMDDKSGDS